MADRGNDVPIRVEGPDSDSAIIGFVALNPGWEGGQPYVSVSLLGPRGTDGKRHRKEKGGYLTFSVARAQAILSTVETVLQDPTE